MIPPADTSTPAIDVRWSAIVNEGLVATPCWVITDTEAGASSVFSSWRDAEGNRQESTEYHSVVAFGRTAEICAEHCVRGKRVYIDGRLRTREYDGSDGLRRTTTEIVAEAVRLLDRRDPVTGSETTSEEPTLATATTSG